MRSLRRLLWPSGWARWVAVAGYTVLIAVIAAVIVVYFLVRGLDRAGEATAEYFPQNVIVYSSINLRPGIDQIDNARSVGDLLRTEEFLDEEEDILEDVEDATGIHPVDDVASWLGTDVTFVLLDLDDDEELVEWVLMAQVSDRNEASDFVEKLIEYIEDDLYTEFDEDEIGDAQIWVADDEPLAIALSNDYLLMADGEDTIEDTLDSIDSPPSRSLAADEQFIAAREAMPEGRVMFVYAQIEGYLDTVENAFDPWGLAEEGVWAWADRNTPEYVAASLSFIDKGMRFDVVSEAASGVLSIDAESDLQSAHVVPENTLFLLAYAGVTDAWQELRNTLEDTDPSTVEGFDQLLDDLEAETGIDLERDVIDSLTGEVSLAVMPGDVRFSFDGEEFKGVIDALLLAGINDTARVEDAFDSLTEWVEDQEIDTGSESIGDYEAATLDMGQFGEELLEEYEAGILITDDWLAVGTTIESLELFHAAAEGDVDSLNSASRFSGFVDIIPTPLHFLMYADISGIVEAVEDGLDADDLEDYEEEVQPFVENLDAFVAASSLTDERWHLTVALTLDE